MEVDLTGVVARLRAAGCVYAEDEAALLTAAAPTAAELDRLVEERVEGLPLEHVLGWALFCGLRVAVGPGVFVPRRRTGFLAAQAVSSVRACPPPAVVVELCCGAGALAATVLAAVPSALVHAADIDPNAVDYARRNLPGRAGYVYLGDLFQALPSTLRGRIDVLMVNTPYVPTAEIELLPAEARLYEPRIALDGGRDGLDVQRRLAADVATWLAPGGSVLVETSEAQAVTAAGMFAHSGMSVRIDGDDELGATVVSARRQS